MDTGILQEMAVRARDGDPCALQALLAPTYEIACKVVKAAFGSNDMQSASGRGSAWDVPSRVVNELIFRKGITRIRWDFYCQSYESYVRRRTWLRIRDIRISDGRFVSVSGPIEDRMEAPAQELPEAAWNRSDGRRRRAKILRRAQKGACPRVRKTLRMICLFGVSLAEVARRLNCPVGTIKSDMYRLRRYLRRVVGED